LALALRRCGAAALRAFYNARWLISTPINVNSTLWFIGTFGAVLLGAGVFLVHWQIERRIDQLGKL
jgi:hypothetical protein